MCDGKYAVDLRLSCTISYCVLVNDVVSSGVSRACLFPRKAAVHSLEPFSPVDVRHWAAPRRHRPGDPERRRRTPLRHPFAPSSFHQQETQLHLSSTANGLLHGRTQTLGPRESVTRPNGFLFTQRLSTERNMACDVEQSLPRICQTNMGLSRPGNPCVGEKKGP